MIDLVAGVGENVASRRQPIIFSSDDSRSLHYHIIGKMSVGCTLLNLFYFGHSVHVNRAKCCAPL